MSAVRTAPAAPAAPRPAASPAPGRSERRLVVAGILCGDRRLVITSLPAALRTLA